MMAKENHCTTTSALHHGLSPEQWSHQPIIPPIYISTNYAQPTPGISDYEYSRSSNPTRTTLERALANLESAKYGLAFCSGLGAVTNTVFLLKSGDHVLCSDDVYGGSHRFFAKCAPKMNIHCTFVDGTKTKNWIDEFNVGKTKMLWIESPTNPMMKITDIEELASSVKKLDPSCLIVVDNTFMTPILSKPLKLGADIVMHSVTKYINGHSDVIMGALMTNDAKIYKELKFNQNSLGVVPSPFDCSQVIRSINTLEIRVTRQEQSAMKIANFLEKHEYVDRVYYPGLKSHPQHDVALKQYSGFGGIIALALKPGNGDEGIKVTKNIKIFHCAVSLGCVKSLVQIPSLMTHASVDETVRIELGMNDSFLRLSIGLEDPEDLIKDIDQALNSAYEE